MIDLVLALVIPFILMIVVTRVTFSLLGAVIVTLMISIFVLQLHHQSWIMGIVALVSLIAGYIVAKGRLKRKPGM